MKTDKNSMLFTTPDKKYSWMIPENWEEYDDGEENTYAFFNTESWAGNFRITTMVLQGSTEVYKDKATQFVEEEIQANPGAIKVQLGDYECAFYKIDTFQNDAESLIYYWSTGKKNALFICSFTIEKDQEGLKENETDLEEISSIISSIRIN